MLCPLCKINVRPVNEKGIMAAICPDCRGIWVGKMALDRLARRELEGNEGALTGGGDGLTVLVEKVAASDTKAELECPYCSKPMVRDRYHPMIPVNMDICAGCDYIWLDAGEQELLLSLYRRLMTDDDPSVAVTRGKLARLDALRERVGATGMQDIDNDLNNIRYVANTGVKMVKELVYGDYEAILEDAFEYIRHRQLRR